MEFRIVTRSHFIAWRDDLVRRALSGMTVRHRLAALSSLFELLRESNAVTAPDGISLKGKREGRSWPPCLITRCGGKNSAS